MTRRLSLALAAIALLLAGSAHALVIDGFKDQEMYLAVKTTVPPTSNPSGDSGAVSNAIGHARKLTLFASGFSRTRGASTVIAEPGFESLTLSNDRNVTSVVTVTWDGTVADPFTVVKNVLDVDLTVNHGEGFRFKIPSADHAYELKLNLWDINNNQGIGIGGVANNGDTYQEVEIPYSSFSGPVDFAHIAAIQLVIAGVSELDTEIDILETYSTPIPGTVLLIGVGLLGLVRNGRRVRLPGG